MPQDNDTDPGNDPAPTLPRTPACDDAIVFAVPAPEMVHQAVARYTRGEAPTDLLGAVLEYVDRHRKEGASVTPLYPERALGVLHPSRTAPHDASGFQIAVPDLRSRRQDLSAFHYLRLAPSAGNELLDALLPTAALQVDSMGTKFYRPAKPVRHAAPDAADAPLDPEWAIKLCGFPEVWNCLDQGPDPGPIGVIDEGADVRHPALDGRIKEFPPEGTPADVIHASQVAAVIAARRDSGSKINGCCSANIHLYNVATDRGFDCKSFYMALKAVARDRLPVVNLSLFAPQDPLVERQIEECISLGMIVVAAMGNSGKEELIFPAAYSGVIAVGATSVADSRLGLSTTGDHICLSAPGEFINTFTSRTEFGTKENHGTSLAAPMVSAAAWLALRRKPGLSPTEMTDLLANSVVKKDLPFREVGHGRLDMREMLKALTGSPVCP